MLALKLAFRNLMGARLRTWLNIIILSMSYLMIVYLQGIYDGWDRQAMRDMIDGEIGGGHYWHENYDLYDLLTLEESHAPVPLALATAEKSEKIAPVLMTQATIYPQGRMQNILLKGISPAQEVITLPTEYLQNDIPEIPVLIGTRMARNANLHIGDYVTIRWRDVNGTFDAAEAKVVQIMKTNVPGIDQGQFWAPLDRVQQMLQMPDEATIIITGQETKLPSNMSGWVFRDQAYLTQDHAAMIKMKKVGGSVMFVIMLSLALLVVFDTQVLAIFRRRKEIGTMIALGMTRGVVIRLFTIEGAMHGALAAIITAIYGAPLLTLQAIKGFPMPAATDSFGLTIADKIYPVYSLGMIIATTAIVMVSVTIVSFLPSRKIAKLNPTDAIRGKIS